MNPTEAIHSVPDEALSSITHGEVSRLFTAIQNDSKNELWTFQQSQVVKFLVTEAHLSQAEAVAFFQEIQLPYLGLFVSHYIVNHNRTGHDFPTIPNWLREKAGVVPEGPSQPSKNRTAATRTTEAQVAKAAQPELTADLAQASETDQKPLSASDIKQVTESPLSIFVWLNETTNVENITVTAEINDIMHAEFTPSLVNKHLFVISKNRLSLRNLSTYIFKVNRGSEVFKIEYVPDVEVEAPLNL